MKYLYLLFLIAGITFCSAQNNTQSTTPSSTTPKTGTAKQSSSTKDSSKQGTNTKPAKKAGSTGKQKSAASDSTMQKNQAKDDSDKNTYGKTKIGPGKGYGEAMTQSPAGYPGGDDSLAVFLSRNFKYMNQNQSKGQHGQVNVGFTIDKTGKILNPIVLKGSGNKDVDDAALRAIIAMPDWKPGMSGGHPVDVQYILPIDYFIPE